MSGAVGAAERTAPPAGGPSLLHNMSARPRTDEVDARYRERGYRAANPARPPRRGRVAAAQDPRLHHPRCAG